MKLRMARKILNYPDERRGLYRSSTLERALSRERKTATTKETNRYWDALMTRMGVAGRAQIVARYDSAAAFRMLMEADHD